MCGLPSTLVFTFQDIGKPYEFFKSCAFALEKNECNELFSMILKSLGQDFLEILAFLNPVLLFQKN